MRSPRFPMLALLLGSMLVLASSCADKPRPRVGLSPPVDLLRHTDKPAIGADALASEAAYERWRENQADWGHANADIIDRACWWFHDAGVPLACAPRIAPKP